MLEAAAFSPAGITSFFEIRDKRPDGRPFKDLAYAGARGGGLVTSRGIRTHVRLIPASKSRVSVRINGRQAPRARTSLSTIAELLRISGQKYHVTVDHQAQVPIGAGYGASAAGTLSAALAFSEAADLGMSMDQLGRVVHIAEIVNGTGLGTVAPILRGGFVLTRKSGAPGIAVIDRVPVSPKLRVVSACFGPISTKAVLVSKDLRRRVNVLGALAFRSITRDLRPRNFMTASRAFADALGLMSRQTAELADLMENAGAIGATQNMVGQAVHAIAEEDEADSVLRAVRGRFPKIQAFSCPLDFAGARII
jgi:pantoate kinase